MQKLQKKMQKAWLKLLKACSLGDVNKQLKYEQKMIELELEMKARAK